MFMEKKLNGCLDIKNWLHSRAEETYVKIEFSTFKKLDKWYIEKETGNLKSDSGKFFSIVGIDVKTNWGLVDHWSQPIINQAEIGILGIITKKVSNRLYCLMQAKVEPGNINYIQLSPTIQATKSNYTQVHQGYKPKYLEYFFNPENSILVDQLQSEQGARFIKKRNRNIVINVDHDVPLHENYNWMLLEEIVDLLRFNNTVNMDTRTVISGLLYYNDVIDHSKDKTINSFEDIIKWITYLKVNCEIEVNQIPLNHVSNWKKTDEKIYHEDQKYFDVIPVEVTIEGREVTKWAQPMIQAKQEGICSFIVNNVSGVYHFLIQGKVECGNFDIVEMAPTVQCLTGNYLDSGSEILPFLEFVLNAKDEQIIYDVMQSEEGGRFYKEQNRNLIVLVDDESLIDIPKNYIWISLHQLQRFILFNNYVNIQARSLISAFVTREYETN